MDSIHKQENMQDKTLWHYTDIAGFQQIMTPGAWLYGTHYRFFSDINECLDNKKLPLYAYFITCFTEQKDNIKLWERWKNKIFCIGFSFQSLLNSAQSNSLLEEFKNEKKNNSFRLPHTRLYKVQYKNHEEHLRGKIQTLHLSKTTAKSIFTPIYKNHKFSIEHEWRLVHILDHIPTNKVEWIANKPRIPIFPIIHPQMIKEIIYRAKDTTNDELYYSTINHLCKNVDANVKISKSELNIAFPQK